MPFLFIATILTIVGSVSPTSAQAITTHAPKLGCHKAPLQNGLCAGMPHESPHFKNGLISALFGPST